MSTPEMQSAKTVLVLNYTNALLQCPLLLSLMLKMDLSPICHDGKQFAVILEIFLETVSLGIIQGKDIST